MADSLLFSLYNAPWDGPLPYSGYYSGGWIVLLQ
jgi:hypothetical protein